MALNKTISFAFHHFFRVNFEPGSSRLALSLSLSEKVQEYLQRAKNAIAKSYFSKFFFFDNVMT
jgi:hypothetical protein